MSKFHVNSEGNPGKCTAQAGNCPFGDESDHHESPEAARTAFEKSQSEGTIPASQSKHEALRGRLEASFKAAFPDVQPMQSSRSNEGLVWDLALRDDQEVLLKVEASNDVELDRDSLSRWALDNKLRIVFNTKLNGDKINHAEKSNVAYFVISKVPAQVEPGTMATPNELEAMPPRSGVMWKGELHRKGVDGHWYYGYGGQSRRPNEMDGAMVKENASVPLLPYVQTPELQTLMKDIDQLRESFPPQVHEVRGLYDAVETLRTTGDSRDYKFALDLLKLRIEDHEDFINDEAIDRETSGRWFRAVEGAQRSLARGW